MATQTVWGPLKALMERFDEHGFGRVEMQRLIENADVLVRIGKGEWSREMLNQSILQSPAQTQRFQPGVLDAVRALGGQFAEARLTTVPGGETLASQRDTEVINFWSDWLFQKEEQSRLSIGPSVGRQVIYIPDLVEDSLRCSYDKTQRGRLSVLEILDRLPRVEGLLWIVGNSSTVTRVFANHLTETGQRLLSYTYTWTSDSYKVSYYSNSRLLVGSFTPYGVSVYSGKPVHWSDAVGLFVLGVPA